MQAHFPDVNFVKRTLNYRVLVLAKPPIETGIRSLK